MSVMFDDSEDNDDSDDDDDDDESSMMNWIMPPPSLPNNNTATVKPPTQLNESPASSLHVSVHLQPPPPQKKTSDATSEDLSLPDLSVDHDNHVVNDDGDSDTESEDTMKLMQESAAIKTYKDSRSPNRTTNPGGAMSIVDKIKNNLQNSRIEQEAQERLKQVQYSLLNFEHEVY